MVEKRIIITGSSSGIGNLLVNELSRFNKIDALFYENKPEILFASKVKAIHLNLKDESAISEYIESVKNSEEEIVFIHAAAISPNKLITDISYDDLINTFSVNTFSAFYFAKKLIPIMMGQNKGSFIFLSSAASKLNIPGTSVYSTSKMSLEQLSNQIVGEYSKFNIRSNVVKLGYFNSGLIKKITPKVVSTIISRIPSQKLGDINEIPKVVQLILECDYINGSVISIDGGIH